MRYTFRIKIYDAGYWCPAKFTTACYFAALLHDVERMERYFRFFSVGQASLVLAVGLSPVIRLIDIPLTSEFEHQRKA